MGRQKCKASVILIAVIMVSIWTAVMPRVVVIVARMTAGCIIRNVNVLPIMNLMQKQKNVFVRRILNMLVPEAVMQEAAGKAAIINIRLVTVQRGINGAQHRGVWFVIIHSSILVREQMKANRQQVIAVVNILNVIVPAGMNGMVRLV